MRCEKVKTDPFTTDLLSNKYHMHFVVTQLTKL